LNFKRILNLVIAAAAIAAAVVVCVVAAAFALYAFARDYVGPAWAAAVVAGVVALFAVVVAASASRKARPAPQKPEEAGMAARLIDLARERPIVAAGAAVAGALLLSRNPKIVTTILSAAIAGRAASKPEPRRR
jgi:hypothetical protein